jgi:predicted CXXCH cytochrome family protein
MSTDRPNSCIAGRSAADLHPAAIPAPRSSPPVARSARLRSPIAIQIAAALLLALSLPLLAQHAPAPSSPPLEKPPAAQAPVDKSYVGSAACKTCHDQIYKSYSATAMARASGPATQDLIPGDFQHRASGVHYRIYAENDSAVLSFERPGDPAVRGTRRLQYFIGSGHRGRTYLFSTDNFFFEAPVNWYAQKMVWDTAPAFQSATQIPMTLPALPGCLSCHTSNARSPVAGTENKYDSPLFAHDGITCERCHGPGAAHSASASAAIVNPAKLDIPRRDAICMQCHLEGSVAIEQPGRKLSGFRAGENLSDYVHYYLYVDENSQKLRALGQSEALALSVCKKKSGDKMSCTTCHDPHSSPPPEQRVAFYRARCLTCHTGAFASTHHADQPDCTSCHMPRSTSADVAHTQATDHRILRVALMPLQGLQTLGSAHLERFPPLPPQASDSSTLASTQPEDPRDLALAWESLAQTGNASAGPEAERFLRLAIVEQPDDPALLDGLAFIEQRRGNTARARELYQHALQIDPLQIEAAANLGVIEVKDGHTDRAVHLWEDAFARAPGRSAIGMNLVRIYCSANQLDKARDYASRVLQFNPDLPQAKSILKQLNSTTPNCTAR